MKHVIVGTGPDGITAARTLRQIAPRDEVVVIAEEDWFPCSRDLAPRPSKVTCESSVLSPEEAKRSGIRLVTGKQVVRIDGLLKTVTLSGGERIPYDRLLIAMSAEQRAVKSKLALVRSAGIAVDRGILVDGSLRTGIRDIFAVGDLTECWDVDSGSAKPDRAWASAFEQGRLAAHSMAGHMEPFGDFSPSRDSDGMGALLASA